MIYDYPLFHLNPKKIRFEDQLSELWTVDSGLWTIIRSGKQESWATGVITDNQKMILFFS